MKHFTIEELTYSDTARAMGIDNAPSAAAEANLERLVDKILDPLRDKYGYPINVSSGYRCRQLNAAVGGSSTSDHLTGCAADICVKRLAYDQRAMRAEHLRLFKMLGAMLQESGQPFNQLIWEKGNGTGPQWIHIALRPRANKCEIKRTDDGKTYYRIDINGNRI